MSEKPNNYGEDYFKTTETSLDVTKSSNTQVEKASQNEIVEAFPQFDLSNFGTRKPTRKRIKGKIIE